jgi:Zn-finger nucleic acid-binding protein
LLLEGATTVDIPASQVAMVSSRRHSTAHQGCGRCRAGHELDRLARSRHDKCRERARQAANRHLSSHRRGANNKARSTQ